MIFEYAAHKTFMGMIDVVDMGNTCLRCTSSETGQEYYLITKTSLGKTQIITFGGIVPDLTFLPDGFNVQYQKIDYKESRLIKAITSFLNDPKKAIAEVEETVETVAWKAFPDIETLFNMEI